MNRIEVQLSGGGHSGLVWSKDSVLRLRRDHRILGSLVGADARFPREMTGLPLLLSEQEIHVLLEEAVIRLVYLPRLVLPLSQEVKDKAQKYDEDSYQKQIQLLKNERELSIRSFADRIVEGKRKKMLQRAKRQKTEENSTEEPIIEIDREKVIAEEVAKIQPIKKEHQVIQIFTQDPWLDDCDKLEARLSPPTSDINKCRLFTFKTLWKKGYYITEGSKFGGDYLVYLGDPVKFHASYIVLCLDKSSHNSLFSRPQDLVAKSRLGGQVHKTVLIAKLNVTKDDVSFTSIRRNFSKRQVQYFLSTDDGEPNSQDHSDDNMTEDNSKTNPKEGRRTFNDPKLVDTVDKDPKLVENADDDHKLVDTADEDLKLVDIALDEPKLVNTAHDDPKLVDNADEEPKLVDNGADDFKLVDTADDFKLVDTADDFKLVYTADDDPKLVETVGDDAKLVDNGAEKVPKLIDNADKEPKLVYNGADDPKLVDNADGDPKLVDTADDHPKLVDNADENPKLVDNKNDEVEEGFEDEI